MQEKEVISILQNQLKYSSKSISDIKIFINELLKANKKHNFISQSTEKVIWHRHILDSAQLTKFIDFSKGSLSDLGSGAGFPGIVLKIINNSFDGFIIEPSKKKSDFIKFVSSEMGLGLRVIQKRFQDIKETDLPFFEIITARAFKPLNILLELFYKNLKNGSVCIFPKGENWENEIETAKKYWDLDYSTESSITNKKSKIIILRDANRRYG